MVNLHCEWSVSPCDGCDGTIVFFGPGGGVRAARLVVVARCSVVHGHRNILVSGVLQVLMKCGTSRTTADIEWRTSSDVRLLEDACTQASAGRAGSRRMVLIQPPRRAQTRACGDYTPSICCQFRALLLLQGRVTKARSSTGSDSCSESWGAARHGTLIYTASYNN